MRKLTEQEVAEEATRIRDIDNWPNSPLLPVKVLGGRELGVVTAYNLTQVFVVSILDWLKMTPRQRAKLEVRNYDSVEAMIEAGWVGD